MLLLVAALAAGFIIPKIDTLKKWDDTGIIVFLIVGTTFILSVLKPSQPSLFAVLVATPIVLLNIYVSGNYGSLLSFAFAFTGAYICLVIQRTIRNLITDFHVRSGSVAAQRPSLN